MNTCPPRPPPPHMQELGSKAICVQFASLDLIANVTQIHRLAVNSFSRLFILLLCLVSFLGGRSGLLWSCWRGGADLLRTPVQRLSLERPLLSPNIYF